MKIKCKFDEPKGRVVDIGGVQHKFLPAPEGGSVCDIENQDHAAVFLRITEGYEPGDQDAEALFDELAQDLGRRALMRGVGGEDEEQEDDGEITEEVGAPIEANTPPKSSKVKKAK